VRPSLSVTRRHLARATVSIILFLGCGSALLLAPLPSEVSAQSGGIVSNLDENASAWVARWCEWPTAPNGGLENCPNPMAPPHDVPTVVPAPSMDGRSIRLNSGAGGEAYANIMYQRRNVLAGPSVAASRYFVLDLHFRYSPSTTFNNADNTPSTIQAIEFGFTKWYGSQNWDWELQWRNVRGEAGSPAWFYWNADIADWVSTGISAPLPHDTWHHLILRGDITNGLAHYSGFSINGIEHPLDLAFSPRANGDAEVTIHVQLDGARDSYAYEVFLDRVSLTWSTMAITPTTTPTRPPQLPQHEPRLVLQPRFAQLLRLPHSHLRGLALPH
jgi:hypothetical protein